MPANSSIQKILISQKQSIRIKSAEPAMPMGGRMPGMI